MWRYGSIRVARIGDIAIDIHLSFILVLIWGAWQGWAGYGTIAGAGYGVFATLLLFAGVLLHEFGHSLQARAYGLDVRRITLLPIGGFAELTNSPSHYWHELLIALAGPAVNLGIALAAGSIAYSIQPFPLTNWADYLLFSTPPSAISALLYVFWVNVLLFVSNMFPAFPMDGGRVLRAALAILTDYTAGTRLAAWFGRLLAVGLVIIGAQSVTSGLPSATSLVLFVVALMMWVGAQQEQAYVRRRRALLQVEIEDVYRQSKDIVAPWDPVTRRLASRAARAGGVLPVAVDGRVVGLLYATDARQALRRSRSATVAHIMQTRYPVVSPQETLWVALQEMSTYQLAALPVMHGDDFYGIINLDDIRRT